MKKIFQASLAIFVVLASLSLVSGVYAGNLSGTVSINPTTVKVGNSYTVTVTGRSTASEQIMTVEIYREGGSGVLYSNGCINSSVCVTSGGMPASQPGPVQYFGVVKVGGISIVTERATINITSSPSSPSTPGSGQTKKCEEGQICNPLGSDNFEDLINAIINNFLIPVGSVVAGVMFVIAGILFVTSTGDPGRVKTAKDMMIWTAVGLAVILVASGLIKVLQSLLGG